MSNTTGSFENSIEDNFTPEKPIEPNLLSIEIVEEQPKFVIDTAPVTITEGEISESTFREIMEKFKKLPESNQRIVIEKIITRISKDGRLAYILMGDGHDGEDLFRKIFKAKSISSLKIHRADIQIQAGNFVRSLFDMFKKDKDKEWSGSYQESQLSLNMANKIVIPESLLGLSKDSDLIELLIQIIDGLGQEGELPKCIQVLIRQATYVKHYRYRNFLVDYFRGIMDPKYKQIYITLIEAHARVASRELVNTATDPINTDWDYESEVKEIAKSYKIDSAQFFASLNAISTLKILGLNMLEIVQLIQDPGEWNPKEKVFEGIQLIIEKRILEENRTPTFSNLPIERPKLTPEENEKVIRSIEYNRLNALEEYNKAKASVIETIRDEVSKAK